MSMRPIRRSLVPFLTIAINLGGFHSSAYSADRPGDNLLDTKIPQFECTNVPVSEAIDSLAHGCTFPINSIMDTIDEPRVTVSATLRSCADILREIVRPLSGYQFKEESGAVLVYPPNAMQNGAFPLNRPLPEFTVEFLSNGQTNTSYGCQLDAVAASSLNVALPFLPLKWTKPNCETFPCVRHYEGRTLLDMLTALSVELHRSWACGRVNPSYVKEKNVEWKKEGYPTYWPNEKLPFYHISWSDRGAFHGVQKEGDVAPVGGK